MSCCLSVQLVLLALPASIETQNSGMRKTRSSPSPLRADRLTVRVRSDGQVLSVGGKRTKGGEWLRERTAQYQGRSGQSQSQSDGEYK